MVRILLLVGLSFIALNGYAQAPTNGGPVPSAPAPAAVPLDGGASLLLASGVAYGLRHMRQRRKAQG